MSLRAWLSPDADSGPCGCAATVSDGRLVVDADRFSERVQAHDERLADRACRDPLAAAREAVGRADPVATVAAGTGLGETAAAVTDIHGAFSPLVGLSVGHWRVDPEVPAAPLTDVRDLPTGATARLFDAEGQPHYHLTPVTEDADAAATRAIETAAGRLGDPDGPDDPHAAVQSATDGRDVDPGWVETASEALRRHATGYGLLADLLADPSVSDAFLTAPATANPVRVVVDGRLARTNVWATPDGPAALASRFRRESGRAFSRAAPTLDASTRIGGRRVRVAGLRPPAAESLSFAFRAHDRDRWRLADLVDNGTLTPAVAALLSLSVERGRSLLLVGARDAGKTTLLGALLWELPADIRTVVVEDTPELPVGSLQAEGRDVQAVRTGEDGGEIGPAEALRTALRLGDGALVVGEVRGEEAGVLYEAMRVGAASETVLGTIHGEDARAARERVVEDLDVSPTAFGATDLVVALAGGADGRRVTAVEEVLDGGERFESLYERPDGLAPTGRIARGNSRLVADLAGPHANYATVRETLSERADRYAGPGYYGSRS